MRLTRVVLGLAALALAAPAAGAEATTFSGSCSFDGPAALSSSAYSLGGGDEPNGACSGLLNGLTAGYEVVWTSSGSGSFSCSSATFAGGETRLDFYRIHETVPGQPRTYVDTLVASDGPGVAGGDRVGRTIVGKLGGTAVEQGRVRSGDGLCGGRYGATLTTVTALVD